LKTLLEEKHELKGTIFDDSSCDIRYFFRYTKVRKSL